MPDVDASVQDRPLVLVQMPSGPVASQPVRPCAMSWAACPGAGAPPPGAVTAASRHVVPSSRETKNWARGMSPPVCEPTATTVPPKLATRRHGLADPLARLGFRPGGAGEEGAGQAGGGVVAGGRATAYHGVAGTRGHDGQRGGRGEQHPPRPASGHPPAPAGGRSQPSGCGRRTGGGGRVEGVRRGLPLGSGNVPCVLGMLPDSPAGPGPGSGAAGVAGVAGVAG